MDMFVVHGGRRLGGRVRVSGAKNAALPIMAAALVADGPTVLHGVPDLVDVTTLGELLTSLGVAVQRDAAPPSTSGFPRLIPTESNGAATTASEDPAFEEHHVHFPFGVPGEPRHDRCRRAAAAAGSRR